MAKRSPTTTITVRVDKGTRDRLEKLAKATARSRSYLAAEAVRAFVEMNEWQIRAIRDGVDAADDGRLVPHKKVDAWLASWGQDDEREPPE